MTLLRVMPKDRIAGYLSANLVDHKGRGAVWIFPERPSNEDVNLSDNFPMISVEQIDLSSSGMMAMDDTEMDDSISLMVNVWTRRREVVKIGDYVETVIWEDGKSIYELSNLPFSEITSIVNEDTGVELLADEYEVYDNDGDNFYDSVSFMGSFGVGTEFTVNYARVAEGLELAEYIAQEAHELLRDHWKTAFVGVLWDYERMRMGSPPFEIDSRLHRCELNVRFKGVNIGD